jgi:hypothetical protein
MALSPEAGNISASVLEGPQCSDCVQRTTSGRVLEPVNPSSAQSAESSPSVDVAQASVMMTSPSRIALKGISFAVKKSTTASIRSESG